MVFVVFVIYARGRCAKPRVLWAVCAKPRALWAVCAKPRVLCFFFLFFSVSFFFLFQRCVLSQEYFGVAFGRFVLSQEYFGSLFFGLFFLGWLFFWGGWCVLGQEYPAGGLCEAKGTPQRLVLSQEDSVIFVISVIFVTLVGVAFFLISRR